ncbi:MAG: tRNA G46 methylase TrmB [Cognaticolwellia sp.]|jgi:tRNA (guanine-N7-)-methyltransferase|tara:strand:- start:1228 stop:1917 length:690 start_codon:yes stop_codon:yes gene_type:complete
MNNTEITGDSKAIVTNQPGVHEKLVEIVNKHIAHPSQKPIQAHTQQAFDEINEIVQAFSGEVILDSCCGVGQSTRLIAKQNPDALVIGVDKSAHRINRNVDEVKLDNGEGTVNNFHLVRADLNDFYRLVVAANWPVTQHYILYPNPWPKAKHVQRRWHGSAVFPQIVAIGQEIILRSNWLLYLEEFQVAAGILNFQGTISTINVTQPLTPFEAKFHASGQQCWQLHISK